MSDPNEKDPLARFQVSAPLYRKTEIAETHLEFFAESGSLYIKFPRTVRRECISCGAMMSWDIGMNRNNAQEKVLTAASYACRNCRGTFRAWIEWKKSPPNGEFVFEKCGQSPKFEVNPPKNLEKSLGEYLDF